MDSCAHGCVHRKRGIAQEGGDFVRSLMRTPCPKRGVELWRRMSSESCGADSDDASEMGFHRPRPVMG